jgi:MFS superfamily sulfate permease-like transporter
MYVYIYYVKISSFTRSSTHIYDSNRLRVKECGQDGVRICLAVLYNFVSILCNNIYYLYYTVKKYPSFLAAIVFGIGIFLLISHAIKQVLNSYPALPFPSVFPHLQSPQVSRSGKWLLKKSLALSSDLTWCCFAQIWGSLHIRQPGQQSGCQYIG